MSNKLRELFEYQRFAGNTRLQALLDDTCARWPGQGEALDDDMLDVAAAGEPGASRVPSGKEGIYDPNNPRY